MDPAGSSVWVARDQGGPYVAGCSLDAGDSAGDSATVVHLEDTDEVAHVPAHSVFPRNQVDHAEADDLSELVHLDEPNILHALRLRHARDAIYTSVGSILVAVNPWKRLQHLTARDTLTEYMDGATPAGPHPYAIARTAYAGVRAGEPLMHAPR